MLPISKDTLSTLWHLMDQGQSFEPIYPPAKQRIQALLPSLEPCLDCPGAEQNFRLREAISPALRAQDALSNVLALWIIKDWGGVVRRKDQTILDWMWALEDFNETAISRLIEIEGTYNVSSWSKLLSFADHSVHAVYDARAAVALNCALDILGTDFRFVIPDSRNKHIKLAVCGAGFRPLGHFLPGFLQGMIVEWPALLKQCPPE